MLSVIIPNNNCAEREYIIETIFKDYLGLKYTIVRSESSLDYSICFADCELVFKDSFFSLYPDRLSYLTKDAIPEKVLYTKSDFAIEDDIPVIFGTANMRVSEKQILCGLDIFASSFFMLTRWEEYVNTKRDKHLRFMGEESLAFKNNFLHRPVVNEYVELVWNLLKSLGFTGDRKKRYFKFTLSHDIDGLSYASPRQVMGDIIKRKNVKLACQNLKFMLTHDPYDTYDFLMTASESIGLKSHFYFMSSNSKLENDTGFYLNRSLFHSKVKEIRDRGHVIGFHPGYYTYNNSQRWQSEKQLLEEALQEQVFEGRQHFLRMDVAKTLSIWEDNAMKIDSTLCYSDKEGFRCGTGDEYCLFNILERKTLRLKERPLIIMDGTLQHYQQYSLEQASGVIQKYVSTGKRYNMGITLLFHNSSFFGEWEGYRSIYEESLGLA